MKCHLCGKTANIILVNKDGEYQDDWVYCCWCFAKEFKKKMEDACQTKGKELQN
jgi:hypothetical protein